MVFCVMWKWTTKAIDNHVSYSKPRREVAPDFRPRAEDPQRSTASIQEDVDVDIRLTNSARAPHASD